MGRVKVRGVNARLILIMVLYIFITIPEVEAQNGRGSKSKLLEGQNLADSLKLQLVEDDFRENKAFVLFTASKNGFFYIKAEPAAFQSGFEFMVYRRPGLKTMEDTVGGDLKLQKYKPLTNGQLTNVKGKTQGIVKYPLSSKWYFSKGEKLVVSIIKRKGNLPLNFTAGLFPESVFGIPVCDVRGKFINASIHFSKGAAPKMIKSTQGKAIVYPMTEENEINYVWVRADQHFPIIVDKNRLLNGNKDTIKLKPLSVDSVYTLKTLFYDAAGNIDIAASETVIEVLTDFMKKQAGYKFVFLTEPGASPEVYNDLFTAFVGRGVRRDVLNTAKSGKVNSKEYLYLKVVKL